MKPLATFLAAGLIASVGAAAALAQTSPVAPPVQKPAVEPKKAPADTAEPKKSPIEEKAVMGREAAKARFKEFKDRWESGKTAGSPLKFEDPVRDIGRVSDDAPVKVLFTFTNTSDKVVKVLSTKASCGCTVPKMTKDIFQPGEVGTIEATYNPQHRRGLEFKDIDVQLDTPGMQGMKIGFLVETLPRVVAEPVTVYMTDVRKGATAKQKLTITGREPGFDVTSETIDPNSPFTVTRLTKSEASDDSGDALTRIEYEVSLKPDQPLGRYQGKLSLATNDKNRPSLDVSVGASVVGDVRVVPENVMAFGQAGTPFIKEVRVDHRMGKPFNITGMETKGLGAEVGLVLDLQTAQVSGQPGEVIGYTVRIAGTFPKAGGNFAGKIILHTDVPDQPTIEVPFQGVIPIVKQ